MTANRSAKQLALLHTQARRPPDARDALRLLGEAGWTCAECGEALNECYCDVESGDEDERGDER